MSGVKRPPPSLPPNFATFEAEYREMFECFMASAKYLDGDRMPRDEKRRINEALDKAAKRFNGHALAENRKLVGR